MFCPNCNIPLASEVERCDNCGADFGIGGAWKPTSTQQGEIRNFRKPVQSEPGDGEVGTGKVEPSLGEKVVKGIGCAILVIGGGFVLLNGVGLLFILWAASWAK